MLLFMVRKRRGETVSEGLSGDLRQIFPKRRVPDGEQQLKRLHGVEPDPRGGYSVVLFTESIKKRDREVIGRYVREQDAEQVAHELNAVERAKAGMIPAAELLDDEPTDPATVPPGLQCDGWLPGAEGDDGDD